MPNESMLSPSPVDEPVVRATGVVPPEQEGSQLEEGLALCLSGGGYRATVFHVGALWRLNELGLLKKLRRISSVSGGSITAATLGLNWSRLKFEESDIATTESFTAALVKPICELTSHTIDLSAIGFGIFSPFSTIGDEIAAAYDKHLFGGRTLQALPADDDTALGVQGPRFVINATNVKTGSLFRFARPYMADYRVGLVKNPKIPLATVVAASSAFPPFLSPTKISLEGCRFEPGVPAAGETVDPSLRREAILTDGGVYDNLGLEAVWKRYKTVLVCDAGRRMADELSPASDWARHSYRLIELLQFQTSNLRRRQIIADFADPLQPHTGAYWGIQTELARLSVPQPLPCETSRALELAAIPTRLAAMEPDLQQRLINWGYAICDASIRSFHLPTASPPTEFPFPLVGV